MNTTTIETPAAGHNQGPALAAPIAADRLRSVVERIERLNEERKDLGGDIKEIYLEARSGGFDVKVLRALIRLRAQDADEAKEQAETLDIYTAALGMD
jgi:uncharacterized protein (UPF0335 family)